MSQQINLYNPIFRQQKKYLSAVTMAQALGLILAGALALSGYLGYRTSLLKKQATIVAAQLKTAQAEEERANIEFAPRQKSKALDDDVRKLESDLQSLQKISDILDKGDLGNTKGYSPYFRGFARQILDGIWLTEISIVGAGSDIGLKGRTLNPELVPGYIARLRSEPVMQGKSFAKLEMQVPPAVPVKGDTAGKPQVSHNYIEFTLQSSGLSKGGAFGARDK